MRSEIASPAASSLALLMRRPEDRRCRAVAKAPCEVFRLRCAFSDAMLVLIIAGILILLWDLVNKLGAVAIYFSLPGVERHKQQSLGLVIGASRENFRAPLLIQTPSRYCVAQEILSLTYQTYAAR